MGMMIFETLFFLGIFIMFVSILLGQEKVVKHVRKELQETQKRLELLENKLIQSGQHSDKDKTEDHIPSTHLDSSVTANVNTETTLPSENSPEKPIIPPVARDAKKINLELPKPPTFTAAHDFGTVSIKEFPSAYTAHKNSGSHPQNTTIYLNYPSKDTQALNQNRSEKLLSPQVQGIQPRDNGKTPPDSLELFMPPPQKR